MKPKQIEINSMSDLELGRDFKLKIKELSMLCRNRYARYRKGEQELKVMQLLRGKYFVARLNIVRFEACVRNVFG